MPVASFSYPPKRLSSASGRRTLFRPPGRRQSLFFDPFLFPLRGVSVSGLLRREANLNQRWGRCQRLFNDPFAFRFRAAVAGDEALGRRATPTCQAFSFWTPNYFGGQPIMAR